MEEHNTGAIELPNTPNKFNTKINKIWQKLRNRPVYLFALIFALIGVGALVYTFAATESLTGKISKSSPVQTRSIVVENAGELTVKLQNLDGQKKNSENAPLRLQITKGGNEIANSVADSIKEDIVVVIQVDPGMYELVVSSDVPLSNRGVRFELTVTYPEPTMQDPPTTDPEIDPITFLSPTANEVVSGEVIVQVDVNPESGIETVEFYLDDVFQKNDIDIPYCMTSDPADTCSPFDTQTILDGEHTVEVRAVDNMNRIVTNSLTFTVKNDTDTSDPPAPDPEPDTPPNSSQLSRPELVNPVTYNIDLDENSISLDNTKDYIVRFPNQKKVGHTTITGGRNIHIIGGHLTLPSTYSDSNGRRVLRINDSSGTQDGRIVHIEGLLIDGSGGADGYDALILSAPKTIVQIVNSRFVGVTRSASSWHSDIIQAWGGIKELRMDGFTGSSSHQGFFLTSEPYLPEPMEKMSFRRVNLRHIENGSGTGYLTWFTGKGTTTKEACENNFPVVFNEVYVQPAEGRSFGKTIWPDVDNSVCPAQVNNGVATWPTLPFEGELREGTPANGDYVPEGVAGVNYDR